MRLAMLSDIHGNLAAFEAVLADIEQQGPFDALGIAGDLCEWGPQPVQVLERVRALGCPVVQGNTDRNVTITDVEALRAQGKSENSIAGLAWTRAQIGPVGTAYLAALPFAHTFAGPSPSDPAPLQAAPDESTPLQTGPNEHAPLQRAPAGLPVEGPACGAAGSASRGSQGEGAGQDVLMVHANPRDQDTHLGPDASPEEVAALLGDTPATVVAFGHLHIPYVRHVAGRLLVDVASVGYPRDGDRRAAYAILDWAGAAGAWQATIHRVPYDLEATVAAFRACGVPGAEKRIRQLYRASYEK